MNTIHLFLAVTVALGASAGTVRAQATAPRSLVITAENTMAGDARHAALAARGGRANDLLPGDELRYRLRFTNTRPEAVKNVVFSNPVPKGLEYVTGSASVAAPDAAITFSIDGGKSYSAQPMIEVVEAGKRREVPAPSAMYTHVRWTVPGLIKSGAQVNAEFRAELAGVPDSVNRP
jgi:uncharacterized repeat protein (TIGR01451 family)